jgi:hypothetical protein
MHPGVRFALPDRPTTTGDAQGFMWETACPLSAICQHASLTTHCAAGPRFDPSLPTSCGVVMPSMVLEGGM